MLLKRYRAMKDVGLSLFEPNLLLTVPFVVDLQPARLQQ